MEHLKPGNNSLKDAVDYLKENAEYLRGTLLDPITYNQAAGGSDSLTLRLYEYIDKYDELTEKIQEKQSELLEAQGDIKEYELVEKELEQAKAELAFLEGAIDPLLGILEQQIAKDPQLSGEMDRLQQQYGEGRISAQKYREEMEALLASVQANSSAGNTVSTTIEKANSTLENHLGEIQKVQQAYEAAGLELDVFSAMHEEVVKQLETLATTEGVTADALDRFIAKWQKFLTLPEERPEIEIRGAAAASIALDEELARIEKIDQAYEAAGISFDDFSEKQDVVSAAFRQLAAEEGITTEKLQLFIEQYKEFLEVEAPDQWEQFTEGLEASLEGMLYDLASGIMTGEASLESLVSQTVSMITSEAHAAFSDAFSGAGSLINLAGGALAGLATVAFQMVDAIHEAEQALETAHGDVKDLFADVYDLEADLADQRLESIKEEMDLLEQNKSLRLEMLRRQFERGEITGEQYYEQATGVTQETAEQSQALEDQKTMITGLQSIIDDLHAELDSMSGLAKFNSFEDERMQHTIGYYTDMMKTIAQSEEGLTDELMESILASYQDEYSRLAQELESMSGWEKLWSDRDSEIVRQQEALSAFIDNLEEVFEQAQLGIVPAAARGADFITRGPQLLRVGDNPGGRERVQVTPLSSPNSEGPQGGDQSIHIHVDGPVYGINDLYMQLDQAGQRLRQLGRVRP